MLKFAIQYQEMMPWKYYSEQSIWVKPNGLTVYKVAGAIAPFGCSEISAKQYPTQQHFHVSQLLLNVKL